MQTRRDAALIVLAVAVVVGAVGVFATWNPFGLLALRALDFPFLVWAAVWLLAGAAAVLHRPRRRTLLLAALPVAAAVYFTGFAALVVEMDRETTLGVVRVLRTPDHEVRLVDTAAFFEDFREVRVRTRDGLLSREWVLWWSQTEDAVDLRLRGDREVEIVLAGGRVAYARF